MILKECIQLNSCMINNKMNKYIIKVSFQISKQSAPLWFACVCSNMGSKGLYIQPSGINNMLCNSMSLTNSCVNMSLLTNNNWDDSTDCCLCGGGLGDDKSVQDTS